LAFTFAQANQNNDLETYDLSIAVSPTTPIITEVMEVGETVGGTLAVSNTGLVDSRLYLTADWGPSTGTSDLEATLLANALTISVYVSADPQATQAYSGSFIGLINQQIVANLAANATTKVYISVTVPDDRSGPTLLGKAINTDFVILAISV
jgi:hypothetical protein